MLSEVFDKPSAWVGLEFRYRELLGDIGQVQRIVDLGVDYGFSMFHFAMHYPDAEVIGVDNFTLNSDSEDWVNQHIHLFQNVTIIKGNTVDVGKSFSEIVDLLHIDADHEYESVSTDFSAWIHVVRPGGRVLFHDTRSYSSTVGRFFRELEGDKREITRYCGLGCWVKPYE
jgi:predicted O-methyltransferase YrrM